MSKLLLKLFSFVIGLSLLIHLLAYLVNTADPTDEFTLYRQRIDGVINSNARAITIGNSHNYAIDFELLGLDGYHLWYGGADYFEINYELTHLLPQLPQVETIFLPISYVNLLVDNRLRELQIPKRRTLYAAFAPQIWPSIDYISQDGEAYLLGLSHYIAPWDMLTRADHLHWVLKSLYGESRPVQSQTRIATDGQRLSAKYLTCNTFTPTSLATYAASPRGGTQRHRSLAAQVIEQDPDVRTRAQAAFLEIVQLVEAQNRQLILFTPPYFHTYTELMGTDEFVVAQDFIKTLQQEYSILYYNFATDPDFIYDSSLFLDDDHLNSCGAQRFSAKLATLLSQLEDDPRLLQRAP